MAKKDENTPTCLEMERIRAYHFLQAGYTAGLGQELPWRVGEERTLEGEIALCRRGYHSATNWYEALRRAHGPVACVVEVSPPVEVSDGEQVSHTRRLVAAKDASRELRLFACDCAERVLPLFEAKYPGDDRPRRAIAGARAFADGRATAEELAAVWAAAGAAAWAAAGAATRDAAWATETQWQTERLDAILLPLFA